MPRVRWLTYSVALFYTVCVLVCAARHEPWFDEAQAWLMARDLSISDLLIRQIRYEGTPALWHLLLMPLAKLGYPYEWLSFVSAALAIAGVWLFLLRSPFPLGLRLLFPFCYFPLYQYAVVARSYALFILLLVGLAICFPMRVSRRPLLYGFLLILLSNSSLHGALIAAVLACEWVWSARPLRGRVKLVILAGLLANYLAIFFQLWPLPAHAGPPRGPQKLATMSIRTVKQLSEAFFGGLGSDAYHALSVIAALAVVALTIYWFGRTTAAAIFVGGLLPLLLLACFAQAAAWHAGLIFLVWIFCLWIFFQQSPAETRGLRPLHVVVAIVFITQAAFGVRSIIFDIGHTYSGSKAAADYLKTSGLSNAKLYSIGFKSFAIQPYFDRNLFRDQEGGRIEAFYRWDHPHPFKAPVNLVREHSDAIIVGVGQSTQYSRLDQLHLNGYCERRRFPGALWWKNGEYEPDTIILFTACATGSSP